MTGGLYTDQVEKECIEKGRCRSEYFHRTDMDCTMYMATYGSGWRIVGMPVMRVLRRMVEHGQRAGIALFACCAAVPGVASRGSCVRRTATGMYQETGATGSGFELPGRLPHESLPLGFQGAKPLSHNFVPFT